jgi:hypothetical protein
VKQERGRLRIPSLVALCCRGACLELLAYSP